jgi:hypothetical protein
LKASSSDKPSGGVLRQWKHHLQQLRYEDA